MKKYALIAVVAISGLGNSLNCMEQKRTGWWNRFVKSNVPVQYTKETFVERTGSGLEPERIQRLLQEERNKWWWQRDQKKILALQHNLEVVQERESYAKTNPYLKPEYRDITGRWGSRVDPRTGRVLSSDDYDKKLMKRQPMLDEQLRLEARQQKMRREDKFFKRLAKGSVE